MSSSWRARRRSDIDLERSETLLEAPSPAALTTYRRDGSAVTSPVWFRFVGDALEVVIAQDDVKLRHLAARPQCSPVIFESVPPFRDVRVEGEPTLHTHGVTDARRSIATRYLGGEDGERFTAARGPGVVLRLPITDGRAWDLAAILPG